MVTWMAAALKTDRDIALQKSQTLLMNRNVFASLHKQHTTLHDKPNYFYRFKVTLLINDVT